MWDCLFCCIAGVCVGALSTWMHMEQKADEANAKYYLELGNLDQARINAQQCCDKLKDRLKAIHNVSKEIG